MYLENDFASLFRDQENKYFKYFLKVSTYLLRIYLLIVKLFNDLKEN